MGDSAEPANHEMSNVAVSVWHSAAGEALARHLVRSFGPDHAAAACLLYSGPPSGQSPDRRHVLILTADDWRQPDLLPVAEHLTAERVVIVALPGVVPDRLPSCLTELNWILAGADVQALADRIAGALRVDPRQLPLLEGLQARASAWDQAGQRTTDLVPDLRSIRHLQAMIRRAGFTHPPAWPSSSSSQPSSQCARDVTAGFGQVLPSFSAPPLPWRCLA